MRTRMIPLELTDDEIEIHSAACCLASIALNFPEIAEMMDHNNATMFLNAAYLLAKKNDEYIDYLNKIARVCTNAQRDDET